MRWYVARCKPTRQRMAVAELMELGFESWFPIFADGKPVFGRYIFVRFDVHVPTWPAIERARTMTSHALVSFGEGPTPVPHGVIERMQADGPLMPLRTAKAAFLRGEAVRMLSGPFQGLTGSVEASLGERVTILFGLMSGRIPVHTRSDMIERVG